MATPVSLKAKLGLIAFGLIIGLGGAEAALRIMDRAKAGSEFDSVDDLRRAMLSDSEGGHAEGSADLREIVTPHPSDKIIYDLRPNTKVKFQRAQVSINSCGMRDSERPVVKPVNTYRIALLGDSFAFGWGVEQNQTFASVLERNLNRISAERGPNAPFTEPLHFEVLNFGVPGYSTFQEVALFEDRVVDFSPDAVLVYFVQNDFAYPFFVRDVAKPGGILSSTRFAQLSWQAIDPKVEEQKMLLGKLDPNYSISHLSNVTRDLGIPLYIAFNPHKLWLSDYNRIPVLKSRKDIHVIKLRRDLLRLIHERNIDEKDLTLSFDPHPSPLRHQILGDLLTPPFMGVFK